MSKKFKIWAFVISIALSFALYGNTLKGEFVWDDVFFTERDELADIKYTPKLFIESVLPDSQAAGLYRPFTMATFTVNLAIHGEKPLGFHIVSILLNALACYLVFLVVYRLFTNKQLAIFTSLFFAFLPIHTEAIALMKARDELFGTIFLLLSWLAFLSATKTGGKINLKFLGISSLWFFVGLLSKEFVVMAPLLFYTVSWVQYGFKSNRFRWTNLLYGILFYAVPFGIYLLMRKIAIPDMGFGNDDIGPLSNILVVAPYWAGFLTSLKIVFIYISKIFVPINLTASYHFKAVTLVGNLFSSPRAIFGLISITTLIWLVFWKKTRKTALAIGGVVFLILYLPVSQFIFHGGDIMGERWMYMPSIGLSIIAGYMFTKLYYWHRPVGIIIFTTVLIAYTSVIIPRNLIWRDTPSLFESMIEDSPRSVRGYSGLGQYYFENGHYQKALETVNKGLSITNQEPNLYVVAASIAYKQGDLVQSEKLLRKALELDTFSSAAALNFPRVLFAQGKYQEALVWFDEIISTMPVSKIKLQEKLLYASILTQLGQYSKSNSYIFDNLSEELVLHDVSMLLSLNYYKLGDTRKALMYFKDISGKNMSDREKLETLRKFKPGI